MILDKSGNLLTSEKSFSNFSNDFSFMYGAQTIAGIDVSPASAHKHAIVYACIRALSESIGQLPVRLYTYDPTGNRTLANRSHPMFKVLTQAPNDFQTWQDMLEMIVTHLNLDGNFYAVINRNTRNKNKIVQFIPIPNPSAVSITVKAGRLTYDIPQDAITGLSKTKFTADEILHIKGPSTDGFMGVSPIRHAPKAIALSMAGEQHGEEFFNNSATPNGYLSTPDELSPEAAERFLNAYNGNMQGLRNSSKTALFEGGMKWNSIAVNNRDAQFLETRNFQKTEICSIFRVPPQMVFQEADVKYSNVEQAILSFHRDTLVPLMTRIVNKINLHLDADLEIDLDDRHLLRGDSKTQAEVHSALFKMSAMTVNEIRLNSGLEAIDGGDVLAIATNNTTLGQLTDLDQIQSLNIQNIPPAPTLPEA
ncbi:phage portal protein [Moritella viscosa]|nr:phage portal protein [Moritella viscosa]CED59843.1 phage portal protein [Moritella viscosa]SHO03536.1 Putative uncharacterized protein [Moritella viscosa]